MCTENNKSYEHFTEYCMKFCPKCGSKNLNYLPWLGEIYECRDCGYRGPLVVEDGEIAEALKKRYDDSDKEEG